MAGFGENLQREREMRGVSLEEIAAATRISSRILRAIETGDLSKLPSGVYARSFVRQYARYLGLDEERVMAEYLLASPPRSDVDLNRMTFPKPPPLAESPRASILVLLIAAVMLATGYLVYQRARRVPDAPVQALKAASAPTAGPASGAPGNVAPPGTPAVSSTSQAGLPAQAGTSSTLAAGPTATDAATKPATGGQPGGALTLQVTATEKSWVAVEADGKPTFERVLKPTEVETIKARESFDVLTGNAAGIVLTLNGQTLSPLGGRNATKRVHLTREDLKNPAP